MLLKGMDLKSLFFINLKFVAYTLLKFKQENKEFIYKRSIQIDQKQRLFCKATILKKKGNEGRVWWCCEVFYFPVKYDSLQGTTQL
jgi:hypothetical protein